VSVLQGLDGQLTRAQVAAGPAVSSQGGPAGMALNQTVMRPDYSEAARKQNLTQIEQLNQSLQAAHYKEQQFKNFEVRCS